MSQPTGWPGWDGLVTAGQAGTGMTGWNLAAPGEHPRTGSCCRQRKKEGERPVPEKEWDLGTQCTRQALFFPRSGLTEKWGRLLHRVQTRAPVSDPRRATHGSGTALRPQKQEPWSLLPPWGAVSHARPWDTENHTQEVVPLVTLRLAFYTPRRCDPGHLCHTS